MRIDKVILQSWWIGRGRDIRCGNLYILRAEFSTCRIEQEYWELYAFVKGSRGISFVTVVLVIG